MIYGYLAIFVTLTLWAGFFLSLKGGAISELTSSDIALMRFVLPALVLSPLVYLNKKKIANVPFKYLAGMFLGCGLPYLLVASHAMSFAPVSHGSALIPGTLPLFVTAIAVLSFKQPLSSHRVIGLGLILTGIAIFLSSSIVNYDWQQTQGHVLFLLGSFMWAVFTISARVANLDALVSAGLVAIVSTLLLLLSIAFGLLDSHLFVTPAKQWPYSELTVHLLLQGVGAGLIAAFTYLYAVKKLGAERSAAFGSATPALATLLAIPVFGEIPDMVTCAALVFICVGSLVASNIFLKTDAGLNYQPSTR